MFEEEYLLIEVALHSNDAEKSISKAVNLFIDRSSLLNKEKLEDIYNMLFSDSIPGIQRNLRSVFKCLCSYYLLNDKNKDDMTSKFLLEKDFEYLFDLFCDSNVFGKVLLRNFYECTLFNSDLDIRLGDVPDKKFDITIMVSFLSDYLRNKFENICCKMKSLGYDIEQILRLMEGILNNHFDINEIKDDDFKEIHDYRSYLKRIMYADIFENMIANGHMESVDTLTNSEKAVLYGIKNNDYSLNFSNEICMDIIDDFWYIIEQPDIRLDNRNYLNAKEEKILKRIHPYYDFERKISDL